MVLWAGRCRKYYSRHQLDVSWQPCECWKWVGLAVPHSQISSRTSKEGFVWAGCILYIVLSRNKTSCHLGGNCLTHLTWIVLASRSWISSSWEQRTQDGQEKVISSYGKLPSYWLLIQDRLWALLQLQMWVSYFQVFPSDTCALKETMIMSGIPWGKSNFQLKGCYFL